MKSLDREDTDKKKYRPLGILLLFLFLFLTFLNFLNLLDGVDLFATRFLQGFFPRFVDMPFSLFSLVGSAELAIVIILLLWILYKKLNIFYVLIGFVFFHVIELIGKTFVTHLGPPHELVRYFFQFSFPSSGIKPGYSYPSGHVGRTMFISTILILIILNTEKFTKINKIIFTFLILGFAAIMFLSRIYLGEHWFSDVLGGGVLGVASALIFLAI